MSNAWKYFGIRLGEMRHRTSPALDTANTVHATGITGDSTDKLLDSQLHPTIGVCTPAHGHRVESLHAARVWVIDPAR